MGVLLGFLLALAPACTIGGGEDQSGGGESLPADDDDAGDDDAGDDDADDDDVDDDDVDDDADDDSAGCDPPAAEFNASPRSGPTPLNVGFTDASTTDPDCPITQRAWAFGDGGTSGETAPYHSYAHEGSYDVTLTVTNAGGSDSITKPGFIAVSCGAPTAAFTASPTSGTVPLAVNFANRSTSGCNAMTYAWDFGDGEESGGTSPTHLFLHEGTFTVTLTARTSGGTDQATANIVTECGPVVADFTAEPREGNRPLNVQFQQTGSGYCAGTYLMWGFGDNGYAFTPNPTHRYTRPGVYTVYLGMTNGNDYDQEIKEDYITVYEDGFVMTF
jgi:PKD repeat protein